VHLLTLVKIAHLMGLIMGLGGAVLLDLTILTRGVIRPVGKFTLEQLHSLSRAVSLGLFVLWATGGLLIWMNLQEKPDYLQNPKLWAKIVIVVILTLNGLLIHRYVMPFMERRIGNRLFDGVSNRMIAGFTFVASVSVVSWFTPFVLGKASELNFVTPMSVILLAYATAVLFAWGALMAMMSGVALIQEQSRHEHADDEPQVDVEAVNRQTRRAAALEPLRSSATQIYAQAAE
jgi:hypothetical protein